MRDVGACAILKKVESHGGSMVLEEAAEIGGHSIAYEHLRCKLRILSYYRFQGEANLVDDVLDYLRLRDIDLYI